MPYNADEDCFICPSGRKLTFWGVDDTVSELGYKSSIKKYCCSDCPYSEQCRKGRGNLAKAKALLTSDTGVKRRGKRCIEPEAVFGDIKFNHGFKLRGLEKEGIEFGLTVLAHNLRKYSRETAGENCTENVKMAA